MASTAPPSTLWQAILARLDPAPEKVTIDSVHEALGNVVGRGTVQRIKDGILPQLRSVTAIAEQLGCDVTDLIREAGGEEVPPAPKPRQAPTIGEVVYQLAKALQPLDDRRRDGIADLVARMLKLGPSTDEALMLDTWTGGVRMVGIPSVSIDPDQQMEAISSDDQGASLELGTPGPAQHRVAGTSERDPRWGQSNSARRVGNTVGMTDEQTTYRSPMKKPATKVGKK